MQFFKLSGRIVVSLLYIVAGVKQTWPRLHEIGSVCLKSNLPYHLRYWQVTDRDLKSLQSSCLKLMAAGRGYIMLAAIVLDRI